MSRLLLLLTATVYALSLTAGLALGDETQRVAALLVTAVLVVRVAAHRRGTAPVRVPVTPAASPAVVVGGAS
jgi:hypothetical protein